MTTGTLIAPPEHIAPPGVVGPARADAGPARTYSCPECGHALRVSGLGRHRVYFELEGEAAGDPVMDRACSECGHALPGKNPPGAPAVTYPSPRNRRVDCRSRARRT
jgi:hypothetical protein